MTKSEILASDLPPVEKIWAIASQRDDIGEGCFGLVGYADGFGAYLYRRFGDRSCPLGAALVDEPSTGDEFADAATLLSVPYDWASSFAHGFDGDTPDSCDDQDGWDAGREIRSRFIEKGVDLG